MRASMAAEPNRFVHARFILAAASRYAIEEVKLAERSAPDREKFVFRALPYSFFAVAGLRMALEYAAHEVQETFLPGTERESTFPICKDLHSFESVMGSRFPGLKDVHPDVYKALLEMQPFSPNGYPSLGILNDLWHHSKHTDLTGTMTHELELTLDDPNTGKRETIRKYFIAYGDGKPLVELLETCVKDVDKVISTLEDLVGRAPPSTSPSSN